MTNRFNLALGVAPRRTTGSSVTEPQGRGEQPDGTVLRWSRCGRAIRPALLLPARRPPGTTESHKHPAVVTTTNRDVAATPRWRRHRLDRSKSGPAPDQRELARDGAAAGRPARLGEDALREHPRCARVDHQHST